MILKLTNAVPSHKNKLLLINTDFVVNIIENTVTREDQTIEIITSIFCPPHGSWEVTETPEQIYAMLTGSSKKTVENLLTESSTDKKPRKKA
jgi:hypothetical protein